MTWFVYALLAALLMTFINFGDKFVVESQVPNPFALIIYLSWFNLIIAFILWIAIGFEMIAVWDGLWLILSGTAPAFAGYFYFQAVSRTEATRIVIISQLTPVSTLILSVLFLQEALTLQQVIGFVLILVAAIAVTLQRRKTNQGTVDDEPIWDVLLLMTISNIIYAVSLVLTDSLVESIVTDFKSLTLVSAYTGFGYWVGGMTLFMLIPRVRRAVAQQVQSTNIKSILALSGVETIFVLRQFVIFMALTLGPVSLVSVIGSLNVFFAIILGWMLTLWQPHIFKEDIHRSTLLRKFMWAGVAFIGIILVR